MDWHFIKDSLNTLRNIAALGELDHELFRYSAIDDNSTPARLKSDRRTKRRLWGTERIEFHQFDGKNLPENIQWHLGHYCRECRLPNFICTHV